MLIFEKNSFVHLLLYLNIVNKYKFLDPSTNPIGQAPRTSTVWFSCHQGNKTKSLKSREEGELKSKYLMMTESIDDSSVD